MCISPEGKRALDEACPMWQVAQQEVVDALGKERYEALLGDVGRTVAIGADRLLEASNGTGGGAA